MRAEDYAEALYAATRNKDAATTEQVFARLAEVLSARGHRTLAPAIVRAFERVVRKRSTETMTVVSVAQPSDAATHEARIRADLTTLGLQGTAPLVRTDPTLVGGYEVRTHGTSLDRTYKRTLIEMYRTLTNH
jgi:F0F1-type ATP synthase delta subunit